MKGCTDVPKSNLRNMPKRMDFIRFSYVTVLSILTTIYGQSARGRVKRFIDNGLPARKSKLRKNKGTWIIKLKDFWKWAKANQDKLNFAHFEKYTLGEEPGWVDAKRKSDFITEQKRPKEWTLADDTALKALINLPRDEVARRLGRTTRAVCNRYWKLRKSEQLRTELAEKFFTDPRTIYRWQLDAIEKISVLVFGIDGLKK